MDPSLWKYCEGAEPSLRATALGRRAVWCCGGGGGGVFKGGGGGRGGTQRKKGLRQKRTGNERDRESGWGEEESQREKAMYRETDSKTD